MARMGRSRLWAWLLVLILVAPLPTTAQQPAGSSAVFTPEQLEQVAAPIALYPDPLLAQVLMASTYPLEVAQAARFVKANPNLKADQLNEKLKEQTWDDSVKSLVSFPQILELMDQKLDWVQKLGDAVLAQQKDLLDAIQRLRARAQKEGNLKSTPEQKVSVEPAAAAPAAPQTVVVQQQPAQVITIEPANPQVVSVPSYNPAAVYGTWPYPAAPPYSPYPPGYAFGAAALSFGAGMAVGAAVWGNADWNGGEVNVNNSNYQNYSKNVNRSEVASQRASQYQQGQGNRSQWQHSPEHRQGVQYRDQASQQRYQRGSSPQATSQSREAFRGRAEQGRQDLGGAQGGARAQERGGGAQGGARAQSLGGGPSGGGGREAGAFQGAGGGGGDAKSFSDRGQSSRQSMGASGGGGGGGGRAAGGGGGARGGGGGGGGRGGGGRR